MDAVEHIVHPPNGQIFEFGDDVRLLTENSAETVLPVPNTERHLEICQERGINGIYEKFT